MGRAAVLKIDILADAKGVGPGVAEADGKLGKLGGRMKAVGLLAAGGLAVGLAVAGKAAFDMARGAAEDEAAQKRLANTLHNTTGATKAQIGAVEDWITAQGKALGVADDDLRPALAKLATATGDVGKAQKLAKLAMDVSAGSGKSLEQVSTALARAQNGNVAGLSRLGVATKDAAGHTMSLDQITGKLARTYDGAASSAANTTAGKWGRVKLQFGELQETIGAKLLPVGARLADWALQLTSGGGGLSRAWGKISPTLHDVGQVITGQVIPAARGVASWFVDKIVPALTRAVQPALAGARDAFDSVASATERNRPQLEKIGKALRTVAEFVAAKVLPVLYTLEGAGFQALGKTIGITLDAVAKFTDGIGWAIDKVQGLIDVVDKLDLGKLGGALGKLPFVGGAAGGLVTIAPQLAGPSPSYDARRGFTSASLGARAWSTLSRSTTTAAAGGGIDARTFLSVNVDGSGIVDETKVRRELAAVLQRWATQTGRPVSQLLTDGAW